MAYVGVILLFVWLVMATTGVNVLTTTAVGVVALVAIVVGAIARAGAVNGGNGGAPGTAPSPASLEEVELPSRQWRYHGSKAEVPCSGCGATVVGGYWSPWTYDPVDGHHHNKTDRYCEPCSQFRQEAEKLGAEGVAAGFEAGDLSEEARDEMLAYLGGLD